MWTVDGVVLVRWRPDQRAWNSRTSPTFQLVERTADSTRLPTHNQPVDSNERNTYQAALLDTCSSLAFADDVGWQNQVMHGPGVMPVTW